MRRGEIFREKGREERDWEGNERERESLEGGRETETEMLGEGKKIRQREKETRDKERCGNREGIQCHLAVPGRADPHL